MCMRAKYQVELLFFQIYFVFISNRYGLACDTRIGEISYFQAFSQDHRVYLV